jgi:hypothetical protein
MVKLIVQYSDKFREWSMLSSETKPTAGVRPGDELVEIDTSKRFKYDGTNSLWVEIAPYVQLSSGVGTIRKEHTFLDAASTPTSGTIVAVEDYKTLTIEIYGTSSSRTVNFYGIGESETSRALMGVKLSDLVTGTSTTGTGELWQFDITGLVSVTIDLTAVAGGNVSVVGRLVK